MTVDTLKEQTEHAEKDHREPGHELAPRVLATSGPEAVHGPTTS
jgi:hypothetical protein